MTIIGIGLALLLLLYFLVATTDGLHFIFKFISYLVPGKLTVAELDGRIISDIHLKNLNYTSSQMKFTVDTLHLRWSPMPLINKKITIHQLIVDKTNLYFEENQNNDKNKKNEFNFKKFDFRQFYWLKNLIIQELSINQLTIYQTKSKLKGLSTYRERNALSVNTIKIAQDQNGYSFKAASPQVNMDGTYQLNKNNDWKVEWHLNIPSIQNIMTEMQGMIRADGKIIGSKNKINVASNLHANKVSIPHLSVDTLDVKINSKGPIDKDNVIQANLLIDHLKSDGYSISRLTSTITSRLLNNNFISHIVLSLDEKNNIRGDIELNNIKTMSTHMSIADLPITGNVSLLFKNVSRFINTPYVKNVEGVLNAEMKLSGKIKSPSYIIEAKFSQGQLFIPKLNISLKDINVTSTYNSKQPIFFTGTFKSGAGDAKLSGKFDPEIEILPLELTLSGKHLQLLNLQEYKISASPDILIAINRNDTSVSGDVLDVSSQIFPKDFSSVTTLPTETIVLGKKPLTPTLPTNLSLQLHITLGEHNVIAYDNLQAVLKGKLSVSQQPGRLPTANGELYTVKGNYRAYGNLLNISQGKLIYAGNLLNDPGLSIKAIKKIEKTSFANDQSQFSDRKTTTVYQGLKYIIVGIDILGTLKKPNISFYSDPAGMSQNDILSYLLFGYPQSEIKNINGFDILNKVAASLNNGPSKMDKITKKIENTFGLSNLSISSIETYDPEKDQSQSSAALNIEKQLSKKFSVQYRVGIFNAQSVLNIKYKINKLFSLQSESSSQSNGIDLLFEYEHD